MYVCMCEHVCVCVCVCVFYIDLPRKVTDCVVY